MYVMYSLFLYTRWFKYDRDYLCVNKPVTVPVIFEAPYMLLVQFFVKHFGYKGCRSN